ncbi:MAG: alanine--tRNA ligase-related protein, partial [bacterium]|nr:alanine--tRNA ligase-related protein [bacterium]
VPSNKDQGYFTRRLMRRAIRFGQQIGIEGGLAEIGRAVIATYSESYPDLGQKQKEILGELQKEEEKFAITLTKGMKEFEKIFEKKGAVSGEDAFVLYSTFGFPLELTEEIAREHGQEIDNDQFSAEFRKHQDLSRSGAEQKFAGGLADHSEESRRLHTATHLLNQALRTVLGNHVEQRGSNITQERLRFDFVHPDKMTQEQKEEVQTIVNEVIKKDLPIHFEVLSIDEAKARGAIGIFDDKYAQLGGKVKVYFIGTEEDGFFSKEVCGGPHVDRTGELGEFKIKKEESSSAGIRRIKANLGTN